MHLNPVEEFMVFLIIVVVEFVNYPTLMLRIQRGLPNSSATALEVVDLRPYFFGLTLPPRAVALVPNANIRKPSFLMLPILISMKLLGMIQVKIFYLLRPIDNMLTSSMQWSCCSMFNPRFQKATHF